MPIWRDSCWVNAFRSTTSTSPYNKTFFHWISTNLAKDKISNNLKLTQYFGGHCFDPHISILEELEL